MKKTRECTPMVFSQPLDTDRLAFEARSYPSIENFATKPFNTTHTCKLSEMWNIFTTLEESLARKKKEKKQAKPKKTWRQKVNSKRLLVASYVRAQTNPNIAEICRSANVSRDMVKKVMSDIAFCGRTYAYRSPNTKSPTEVARLRDTIQEVAGTYVTIKDIRRLHRSFSRKWISRELRRSGFKWLMMIKRRRITKKENNRGTKVVSMLNQLAQAIPAQDVLSLYVDEVHFPLYQTTTHHWRRPSNSGDEEMVYNRRPFPEDQKLSVIALCSLKGFLAIQVYKQDIKGEDFLYFLQEALYRIPSGKKVTILADNATWHTAKVVNQSKAGKYLFFNAPGLFRANAIENAFSFIRAEWRKRRHVETLEEEACTLAHIFFHPQNTSRFVGIARNHARSLRGLVELNWSADEVLRARSQEETCMMDEG